ncbi:MAG: hypothetical protein HRT37_26190 [Alteromonadaceae bacterium]|nr:hypothetical protein [Alteromonadaceae bacterium]
MLNRYRQYSNKSTILVMQDDNAIGSIDADDKDIRVDIDHKISLLFPKDAYKKGYLEHVSFYLRAFFKIQLILIKKSSCRGDERICLSY